MMTETNKKEGPIAWMVLSQEDGYLITITENEEHANSFASYVIPLFRAPQDEEIRRLQEFERDAMRYRWLRDSSNQLTEDDPCVCDSSFNTYFGIDLDKTIDTFIGLAMQAEGERV